MRGLAVLVGVATLLGTGGGTVAANGLIATFNPALGEFPEGIAIDRQGSMYVSLALTGQVRRRADDGTWSTAHQFPPDSHGRLAVLGLAADRGGTIYVAVPSDDATAHGVWALPPDGPAHRLAGTQAILFPNGIALDGEGGMFVSDSVGGAIWHVQGDGAVVRWLADPLLAGTGLLNGPAAPLGANGVAYLRGQLTVANTEKRLIVRIPVDEAGAPGTPHVLHAYAAPLDLLDGVALDVVGNVYAVVHGRRVDQIDAAGHATTLATYEDSDLVVPASLAFGTRGGDKRTLFITNLSLPPLVSLAFPEGGVAPLPGIVAVEAPLSGPPLP